MGGGTPYPARAPTACVKGPDATSHAGPCPCPCGIHGYDRAKARMTCHGHAWDGGDRVAWCTSSSLSPSVHRCNNRAPWRWIGALLELFPQSLRCGRLILDSAHFDVKLRFLGHLFSRFWSHFVEELCSTVHTSGRIVVLSDVCGNSRVTYAVCEDFVTESFMMLEF